MAGRIVGASVLAGLIIHIWSFLSWTVFALHDGSMRKLPQEAAVAAALKQSVPEAGVYGFPAWPEGKPTEEGMKDFEARHRAGPLGFLVFRPTGEASMPPSMFVKAIGFNIFAAFLVCLVVARLPAAGFWCRWSTVLLLGLFACVTTPVSQWIWFRFPTNFTGMACVDLVIAWALAGLVIAGLVRPNRA